MFNRNGDDDSTTYSSGCYKCGCKVKIKIDKTSGGFGLQGGILHESESEELRAECLDCYKSQESMSAVMQEGPVGDTDSAFK
jgi:hypothetical protein